MHEVLKDKSISVIIPAYDEPLLLNRIEFIENELKEHINNLEIIVVCDGKGRTPIKELEAYKKSNIKIYSYGRNRGKGFALKFGSFKAKGDYIFFIDGGPELHPQDIRRFLLLMEAYETDVVIGSKRHPLSNTNYSFFRKTLSFGYQLYISLLLGLKFVKDTQVGLKLFKGSLLREIMPQVKTLGYAFDIELLSLAHRINGIRIIESPITLIMAKKGANASKEFFRLFKMTLQMMYDTLKIVYRIRLRKNPSITCLKTWGFSQEYLDLQPINHPQKSQTIHENTDHRSLGLHRNEPLKEATTEWA